MNGLTPNPGRYRQRDVEISGSRHRPPPWSDVPRLVDEMCADLRTTARDPVALSAFVLWRLNWIHPFEEGNGRTARAVAYLLLSVALGRFLPGHVTLIERIVWHKLESYRALEAADAAWQSGRCDVSVLTAFIRDVLEAQLEETD